MSKPVASKRNNKRQGEHSHSVLTVQGGTNHTWGTRLHRQPDRFTRGQYNDGTEPTTNSTNSKTYRYNHAYQSVTTY